MVRRAGTTLIHPGPPWRIPGAQRFEPFQGMRDRPHM